MPISRGRLLGRIGEHEAAGALTHEAGHRHHAITLAHDFTDTRHVAFGGTDIRALTQLVVDEKHRRAGIGKELLLDLTKAVKAHPGDSNQRDDGQRPHPQGAPQHFAVSPVHGATIRILFGRIGFDFQQISAEQRRYGDGQNPAQQQRHRNHRKQREQELAGRIGRQANARKRHDADYGSPQQRHLRAARRIAGSRHGGHATLHIDQHAFGDHDRIVNQHAHGNDQCAQRNPFHLNIGQPHHQDGAEHRQQQGDAHHQSNAPAHEHTQHANHDRNRHRQIDDKAVHRLFNHHVLFVDGLQAHAERNLRGDVIEVCGNRLTDFDDIGTGRTGDRNRERRLAIEANQGARILGWHAPDGRHIEQTDLLGRTGPANAQRRNGAGRIESGGRGDAHAQITAARRTGVDDGILGADRRNHLLQRQAQRNQALVGNFDVNGFGRLAAGFHLGHAVNGQQFAAQIIGNLTLLLVRIAFGHHRIEDSEYIAKVIVDHRRARAIGQADGSVVDLVAQLAPDSGQLCAVVGVLDFEFDLRHTGHRLGLDALEFGQLLNRGFQRLGNFLLNLGGRRARVLCGHDGVFQRERRVFEAADRQQAPDATQQTDQCNQPGVDWLADGVTGDIHDGFLDERRRISDERWVQPPCHRAACAHPR